MKLTFISVDPGPGSPIYLVNDVRAFLADHPGIVAEAMDIPDGSMATFTDPAGHSISVLDQMGAA